jgi:predicted esterase/catechol 2,3-dioxygenase-like lactoylglutathione lyase family enzyme
MVKQTVNFDDPGSYHFYFGDAAGSPGTALTFFPWPGAPRGTPGSGAVTATAFSVPVGSLGRWATRLREQGVEGVAASIRFGQAVLAFEDPDGTALELVETPGVESLAAWTEGSIDTATAIRGFHSATLSLRAVEATARLLIDHFGMTLTGTDGARTRYTASGLTGGGTPAAVGTVIDLLHTPNLAPGRSGTGTVHHIAVRATGDDQQARWQQSLHRAGFGVTAVRERDYFRSIYFRERGGVLFEIATDGPGFTIDETPDTLGTTLRLPKMYESQRAQIVAHLPPVSLSSPPAARKGPDPVRAYHHAFIPARMPRTDGRWVLLLHGTGGDEQDLLPLGEKLLPGAAMLSPRGDVNENGQNRFFKRFAEGVFDLADVQRAAAKLAAWIDAAVKKYGLDPALGTIVGFSNGANVAAAMLLTRPTELKEAVLIRSMVTLERSPGVSLGGSRVLILSGTTDPIVPVENSRRLAGQFRAAGADVQHVELPVGHTLAPGDLAAATAFVQR